MTRAAAGLLVLLASLALADDAPRTLARARVDPPGPVAVGQTVRIVVDVLVTTWLTGGVDLPPLAIAGAVVTPSDERAPHLTESIDGTSWFGVSRIYLLTPTEAGPLTIPPIALTVVPGEATAPVTARTAPLTLTVVAPVRPPGAEHALAAAKLHLTQHLDRKLDGLRVGDSIERTVTVAADGVRAMFLPPAAFPPLTGIAIYPAPAHVDDLTDERGTFTGGRRIDAATYVVQAPGRYTLPAITVQWWDTQGQKLQTATASAITFDAAANAAAAPEIAIPADASERTLARTWQAWRRPALLAMGLLVAGVVLWLLAPSIVVADRRLATARADRHRRWEASEAWAFDRVTESLRGDDPTAVYHALLRWVERLDSIEDPIPVTTLGARVGDAELTRQLAALADTIYGDGATAAWSVDEIAPRLQHARRRLQDPSIRSAIPAVLPPLNP